MKINLEKNNVNIVEELFQEEEKIQTIYKPKECKRIIVLNLYIKETLRNDMKNTNDLISRKYDGDILVKFKAIRKLEYINVDKYKIKTQK